jgi:hypothetical protein
MWLSLRQQKETVYSGSCTGRNVDDQHNGSNTEHSKSNVDLWNNSNRYTATIEIMPLKRVKYFERPLF